MSVDYNILAHLHKLLHLLSIYDTLILSKGIQETLIKIVHNPKQYEPFFDEEKMKEDLASQKLVTITFNNDDLLLWTF